MKKLVLFFAAIVAVSFASCGPKAAETETATVVDSVVVVDVDTTAAVAVDSTVVAQ